MIKLGLEDEAKKVIELVKDKGRLTSFQAIGYKEFLPYFEGKTSLQEAIDNIKQESRRYAKRQITWFKRTEGLTWIDMSCDFEENVKKIINYFEGVM